MVQLTKVEADRRGLCSEKRDVSVSKVVVDVTVEVFAGVPVQELGEQIIVNLEDVIFPIHYLYYINL